MRLILALTVATALTSCATTTDTNKNTNFYHPNGATQAQYSQDSADCKRKSLQPVSNSYVGPYNASGTTAAGNRVNYSVAIACMEALGYRQADAPKSIN